MTTKISLTADAYTVGLIYVKPLEMHAISVMLDEHHEPVPMRLEDDNEYTLGKIGNHNVAIAGPPRGSQGKVAIANVVSRIRLTFKNIRVGLMVGIGGGVPYPPEHDVRLGDVVVGAPEVGPAVVQYDLGKQLPDGIEVTRTLNKPPELLLKVVDKVDNRYRRVSEGTEDFFADHLQRFAKLPRMRDLYKRPSIPDRLFRSEYDHPKGTLCSSHDYRHEVKRPDRDPPHEVRIHYSTILSGDLVMKSALRRDQISAKYHNALCFEMEAAGLMDVFPCVVVRGICDYSDSHKSKEWQEYAAAVAAAYAREILLNIAERVLYDLKDPEIVGAPGAPQGVGQTALRRGERVFGNSDYRPQASSSAKKSILSFDGGGIRGYSSLMILERLMGEIQKTLGLPSTPSPYEYFDIIGGAGTGGIIAVLLGRLRMSVEEALTAYNQIAELSFTPESGLFSRFFSTSKYSGQNLAEAVCQVLQNIDRQVDGSRDAVFVDPTGPRTVVLAMTKVNIGAGPTLFKTYDVEPAWKDCKIWEVARATSATLTFFPSIKCGRDQIEFIDAGFGYNNPCEVVLAEAEKAIPDREMACVVSIGTGLGRAIGITANPQSLLGSLKSMATSSNLIHARLQGQYGAQASQKYWRFDEDVAISDIAVDDWKQVQRVAGHTHNYLNTYATEMSMKDCVKAILSAHAGAETSDVRSDSSSQSVSHEEQLDGDEESQRLSLLKMLSFPEMQARESKVDSAYKATYDWIQSSKEYQEWESCLFGKLLIKGKAGCGKSTLMKHLLKKEELGKNTESRSVVCGFFFNARGATMETSIEAMLRTLLYQLLLQDPILYRRLRQFHSDMKVAMESQVRVVDWTRETLMQMFEITVRSPGLTGLVYIDALDEGEGFLPSSMFAFLESQLSQSREGSLKICLSSRPNNFINHRAKWTTIDLGNCNSVDIKTYATTELSKTAESCPCMGYESMVPKLAEDILLKAQGVFLWVKLVVEELLAAMNDYEPKGSISDILFANPADLWELYLSCLQKVKEDHRPETIRILQIILVAERPLSIEELMDIMAVASVVTPFDSKPDSQDSIGTPKQMKIRVLNLCRGLVEVAETDRDFKSGIHLTTEVQFMHQSVKDFLRGKKLPAEFEKFGSPSLEASGHGLMFKCCLHYLLQPRILTLAGAEGPNFYASLEDGKNFWNEVLGQHAFLFYSPFWITHADRFLQTNPESINQHYLQQAKQVFSAWHRYPYQRYLHHYHSLYSHVYENVSGKSADNIYSSLIAFAAYQSFVSLFKALLFDAGLHTEDKESALSKMLVAACDSSLRGSFRSDRTWGLRHSRTGQSEKRGFTLSETAWRAKQEMVGLLIERGANVNRGSSGKYGSPLIAACWGGRESLVRDLIGYGAGLVRNLIGYGADINMSTSRGYYATPLIAACWGGSLPVAKLLIDRGAKINMRAGKVGSALAEASLCGEPEMVEFLIDQGAIIDMPLEDGVFGSALIAAAEDGSEEVVKLLVARGADVNLQPGSEYGSALSAAAHGCTRSAERIMKYLIEKGAIVDMLLQTGPYGSALVSSSNRHRLRMVKPLVKNGADVNLELKRGNFGTALIAAATSGDSRGGKLEILEYLIKQGARVNERPTIGKYGSALVAAASCRNPIGVKLLIDRGADVNLPLRSGDYVSALAATAREHGEWGTTSHLKKQQLAIKLMIDMGADVDAVLRENKYGPAFLETLTLCRSNSIEAFESAVEDEDKDRRQR